MKVSHRKPGIYETPAEWEGVVYMSREDGSWLRERDDETHDVVHSRIVAAVKHRKSLTTLKMQQLAWTAAITGFAGGLLALVPHAKNLVIATETVALLLCVYGLLHLHRWRVNYMSDPRVKGRL